MLQRACSFSQEQLLANHRETLTESTEVQLNRLLTRRQTREPLAYILGEKEFYGRTFRVDRSVLIPRPETEILIDRCIEFAKYNDLQNPNIIDIGTGSGIIAATIAKEIDGTRITATDISADALEIAQTNADDHSANVRFVLEDVAHSRQQRRYDIVVSNPPYIKSKALETLQPEVRDWEPRQALDGGADGMNVLRPLIRSLPNLLRNDAPSAAFIEMDPPVAESCIRTAHASLPDADVQVHRDYGGLERVLVVLRI